MAVAAHESRGDRARKKSKARLNGAEKPDSLPSSRTDSLAADALEEDPKKPKNWADDPESAAYKAAQKLYKLVASAYENMSEQSDRIEEYWNVYNAQPDENLQYTGNTSGYVPVVRDAINARTKRCLKLLFPSNHKHVNGISSDAQTPFVQLAMLEHYVRKTRLKSIVRSDLVAGDVTGQWGLMVDWFKTKRTVTKLVKKNPIIDEIDGENVAALEIEDASADEEEGTETEEVEEQGPDIVDFAVEDLAVVPPTCNDLQRAQCVSLRLRLDEEAVKAMVDAGELILPDKTDLADFCKGDYKAVEKRNRAAKQSQDAGVKTSGTNKYALLFMVYTKLDLGGDSKESAIIFYGGKDVIVGILKNPLWSGKVPILSEPIERVKGSFYGKSKIEPVKFMQWNLVDFWNMGQDSAMYSLMPIYTVDPLKAPNWATLVAGLGAVWPVGPTDVKTLVTPQLWKDSVSICDAIKRQIWESMDVNEMMMGKVPPGRKNNQMMGQLAQEQATNITDHAERYEEVILNPLVEMLFEFDQQFRTDELEIEQRGEIGVEASVKSIPVPQWGERYFFRWMGSSFQATMQRMQQMTGWVNVMKGIPPQMMPGRKLDLTPFIEMGTEQIFGPEIAPKVFIDQRNMFTVDPDMENSILHNGMPVEVHEADNDQEHLQSHMRAAELTGDPTGIFKAHLALHVQSLQAKREREMAGGQGGKGVSGSPGGPPGAAGAPRPGAVPSPAGGRPAQQPPGAIQQDDMLGAPGRG